MERCLDARPAAHASAVAARSAGQCGLTRRCAAERQRASVELRASASASAHQRACSGAGIVQGGEPTRVAARWGLQARPGGGAQADNSAPASSPGRRLGRAHGLCALPLAPPPLTHLRFCCTSPAPPPAIRQQLAKAVAAGSAATRSVVRGVAGVLRRCGAVPAVWHAAQGSPGDAKSLLLAAHNRAGCGCAVPCRQEPTTLVRRSRT